MDYFALAPLPPAPDSPRDCSDCTPADLAGDSTRHAPPLPGATAPSPHSAVGGRRAALCTCSRPAASRPARFEGGPPCFQILDLPLVMMAMTLLAGAVGTAGAVSPQPDSDAGAVMAVFKYNFAAQFLSRIIPFLYNGWFVRQLNADDCAFWILAMTWLGGTGALLGVQKLDVCPKVWMCGMGSV
uniref:Uncharacterized protein n=1 Tax=Aegilops tauschii subsp. strangulata TaxID=200361 RepID=A0A453PUX7_AEGTS